MISVALNKDGHCRKPLNNTDAETGWGIDLWHLSGAVQDAHYVAMWSQLLSFVHFWCHRKWDVF